MLQPQGLCAVEKGHSPALIVLIFKKDLAVVTYSSLVDWGITFVNVDIGAGKMVN